MLKDRLMNGSLDLLISPFIDKLGDSTSLFFENEGMNEIFDLFEELECFLGTILMWDLEHGLNGWQMLKLSFGLLLDFFNFDIWVSLAENFIFF